MYSCGTTGGDKPRKEWSPQEWSDATGPLAARRPPKWSVVCATGCVMELELGLGCPSRLGVITVSYSQLFFREPTWSVVCATGYVMDTPALPTPSPSPSPSPSLYP